MAGENDCFLIVQPDGLVSRHIFRFERGDAIRCYRFIFSVNTCRANTVGLFGRFSVDGVDTDAGQIGSVVDSGTRQGHTGYTQGKAYRTVDIFFL